MENQKDKKEDKVKRIATAIGNIKEGEAIAPSKLFKEAGIHPSTGKDILDLHDTLKDIGFVINRDKKGNPRFILKQDETLDLRNRMRNIEKKLIDIEEKLDTPKK